MEKFWLKFISTSKPIIFLIKNKKEQFKTGPSWIRWSAFSKRAKYICEKEKMFFKKEYASL